MNYRGGCRISGRVMGFALLILSHLLKYTCTMKMKYFGHSETRLFHFHGLTETKLFHFHGIFKNWDWGGGENPP